MTTQYVQVPREIFNTMFAAGSQDAGAVTLVEEQQEHLVTGNTAPAQPASQAGSVIRAMLSQSAPAAPTFGGDVSVITAATQGGQPQEVNFRGARYRRIKMAITEHSVLSSQRHENTTRTYKQRVNSSARVKSRGGLVDNGSNGGMAGDDCLIIGVSLYDKVDIIAVGPGIKDVPIGTAVTKVHCKHNGTVIAFFHQYACQEGADGYGIGPTIHSTVQLESFGLEVQDHVCRGPQYIKTPDGFEFELRTRAGLTYLKQARPTLDDLNKYPHVFFTSDMPWDPTQFDDADLGGTESPDDTYVEAVEVETVEENDDDDDFSVASSVEPEAEEEEFEQMEVNYTKHELNLFRCLQEAHGTLEIYLGDTIIPPKGILPKIADFELLRPYFGWVPAPRVKATLENTTQFYKAENRYPLRKHYKTRFPAANVPHIPGTVASDTWISDTPALYDGQTGHGGCTLLQIFHGVETELTEGIPVSKKSDFPQALMDFIRIWGAPANLFTDGAWEEASKAVNDIFRHYHIGRHMRSEPYHQHQNPAERKIQDIQRVVNGLLDRTGARPCEWLLCALFVIDLFNHLAQESLNGMPALQKVSGQVIDVSQYLAYTWRQPVYYSAKPGDKEKHFPGQKSGERLGLWMGPCRDHGDVLTYWILDVETDFLEVRSELRPADDRKTQNFRANATADGGSESGEENQTPRQAVEVVQSLNDVWTRVRKDEAADVAENPEPPFRRFAPDELPGMTFLRELPDGQKVRAEVVRKIEDMHAKNHKDIMFLLDLGGGGAEELMGYVDLCDHIDDMMQEDARKEIDGESFTFFKGITGHRGPLSPQSPNWKGSTWNVLPRWDDGSITEEPLNIFIKDDPVSCAVYAKEHGLLDTNGWKSLQKHARRLNVLERAVKQMKMKAQRRGPIYKFGARVPRDFREARRLQEEAGHTKWTDAELVELKQVDDFNTFKDIGKGTSLPRGYTKIRVHFVYDMKHDGRYKARLVAGGHLTDPDKESTYSGVVSLRSMRLALLIGELNGLDVMVGDIGNAYLTSNTREKVGFVAGPEFGEREGHTLIIIKALYGLRSSGARFHEKLSDTLRAEGFQPSLSDSDLWYRDAGDCYEYVCVYVDDLAAVMKNPAEFFRRLEDPEIHGYSLKGVGPPEYHLGGNFGRDPDGTLWWGSKTYVEKMLANYERQFGSLPKKQNVPMDDGDHPEMDTSDIVSEADRTLYMSLVGAMQWAVTLGRFDIGYATMVLSRFRAEPRIGHLERVKHVFGYLRKNDDARIRFRIRIPHNELLFNDPDCDWMHHIYGEREVELFEGLPVPKGKVVRISTFIDSGLHHCKVSGKASTCVLQFVNQTPVDWYFAKQSTVENSTYGSEFVAARTGVDRIIDLLFSLKSIGVPVEEPVWMLGDNQSVVTSSTIQHSVLSKRWVALSYHRVRAGIAHKILRFCHVDTENNVSDVGTKALARVKFRPLIDPILFTYGDTMSKADYDEKLHMS